MYFLYGTMRGPLCQSGTHFHSCASFRGCCATNPCKNEKGECPASLKYPRDAAPKQVTEELLAALGEPSLAALGVEAGNQVLNPLDAVAVLPPFRAGSATLSGSATTTSTIMGTPSSRLHGGIGAEKISGFITAAVGSFTLVLLLSLFIMAYTKDPVNRRYKRDHGSGADNHQVDAESLFALDSEDERSRSKIIFFVFLQFGFFRVGNGWKRNVADFILRLI